MDFLAIERTWWVGAAFDPVTLHVGRAPSASRRLPVVRSAWLC